jgi:hypothetical protein
MQNMTQKIFITKQYKLNGTVFLGCEQKPTQYPKHSMLLFVIIFQHEKMKKVHKVGSPNNVAKW